MKYLLSGLIVLFGLTSFAEQIVVLKGRVLRIEDGKAVIKTIDGNDVLVAMANLSKDDKKKVSFASGKKKDVELRLAPTAYAQSPTD